MVTTFGSRELFLTQGLDLDRWLRSPDHQQVMRVQLSREDDNSALAMVEVRSVMGGLPTVRRLTRQAALRTWICCRQNGWSRCQPQW
ncbi:MAG: DUF1651 domain-containing protein [Synechococcus sp.]